MKEGISIRENEVGLLSTIQIREHGIDVNNKAKIHGGKQAIISDEIEFKFKLKNGLLLKSLKYPTEEEINSLQHITLTSDFPWDPTIFNDEENEKSDNDSTQEEVVDEECFFDIDDFVQLYNQSQIHCLNGL